MLVVLALVTSLTSAIMGGKISVSASKDSIGASLICGVGLMTLCTKLFQFNHFFYLSLTVPGMDQDIVSLQMSVMVTVSFVFFYQMTMSLQGLDGTEASTVGSSATTKHLIQMDNVKC